MRQALCPEMAEVIEMAGVVTFKLISHAGDIQSLECKAYIPIAEQFQ
jgi:hypothetical protein